VSRLPDGFKNTMASYTKASYTNFLNLRVVLNNLNDYNIELLFRFWINNKKEREINPVL
jgi:hypothetical protein